MIEGLTKHHSQGCGPVQINTYFSPRVPVTDFGNNQVADPWQYRIAFELVNATGPAGLKLQYQPPMPLYFFFKIGRQNRDGSFTDLTQSQIGLPHVGDPKPRDLTFAAKGDAFYDRVSYAAFATIAPPSALAPGRFRISLKPFPIVSIDGKDCVSTIPPMDIEVTKAP